MTLDVLSDLASIIESALTAFAIVVGGFWTYFLFVQHRQRLPSANIEHALEVVKLPADKTLVHLAATVANTGKVLVSIEMARTRIQQIAPVADHILFDIKSGKDPVLEHQQEVPWPMIGESREWNYNRGQAEIEPGEKEVLHSEFVIPSSVTCIVAYTYVKNHAKRRRDIGWSRTSIFKLDSE